MISKIAKVLIVDDSLIIGNRLKEMLVDCGDFAIVEQAFDIEKSKNLIWRLNPEIIILDIGFQGHLGMSLIPEIKKRNANTMVIMFTNYSHRLYREKCKELGADYFFDKSTEFDALTEYIERYSFTKLSA